MRNEGSELVGTPAGDLSSRMDFLFFQVKDTQETIRFLDTKAVFCVTLISGSIAVSVQHPFSHHPLFAAFLALAVCSVMACLRVIFPTFRPHGGEPAEETVKFYLRPRKHRRWAVHTFTNPNMNILQATHASYLQSVFAADDAKLVSSLAETVHALASIRQLKTDRLHAAMYLLVVTLLCFAVGVLS